MIEFEWPWAFALIVLPLLVQGLLPPAAVAGAIELPIADELRTLAAKPSRPVRRYAPLPLLVWGLLIVAGAQPRWIGAPVPLPVHARDLLLAVDGSGSMAEKDIDPPRRTRSRYEAVQAVAGDFLRRRQGDRVGLILFGTQAYLYAPLSLDRSAVSTLLAESEIGLAGESTAIGDAIALGVKHLRESSSRERVLILLTDGDNTAGIVPPAKAAELAASAGIRIHTIGFGADTLSSGMLQALGMQDTLVQEEPLKRIAKQTGGRYFRARDTEELGKIYALLDRIEPVEVEARTFRPTRSLFHWPLAAALTLALVVWVRRHVHP